MIRKNFAKKRTASAFSEFFGIDRTHPHGKAAHSVDNFRLMPDGSLKKRSGYIRKITLPGTPRCVFTGGELITDDAYALVGNAVYKLDLESGSCGVSPIGYVTCSTGDATVFRFRDMLMISDGLFLHRAVAGGFDVAEGYIPLYGKDWDPHAMGSVNEALNYMSTKFRISYRVTEETHTLEFGQHVSSIDRVTVNGTVLSPSDYTLDVGGTSMSSDMLGTDSEVIVWLSQSAVLRQNEDFGSCRYAAVGGGGDDTVIFCFGSAADESYIYRSKPVPDEKLAEVTAVYPDTVGLYFPYTDRFTVGRFKKSVRAVLPVTDKVIAYTDDEAWLVPVGGDSIEPVLLNTGVGCTSYGGAVFCGENPVTVSGKGVYIWAPDATSYNEFSAFRVSDPVAPLISERFPANARLFNNRADGELWIYDPGDENSGVLIYNYVKKNWYTFSGFLPEKMFLYGDAAGFSSGEYIYAFDTSLVNDHPVGLSGEPITATYISAWNDFDDPESKKRLGTFSVTAYGGGGGIGLTIENEVGVRDAFDFKSDPLVNFETFCCRPPMRRFSSIRYVLTATGSASHRIFSVTAETTA